MPPIISCTLPCSMFCFSLPHSGLLVPLSSISVTRCSGSSNQQTCGNGGRVSVFSFLTERNSLKRIILPQPVLATTQERSENDDESPLAVTDLRELCQSASSPSQTAATSASDGEETRQAQDTQEGQALEEHGEGVGPTVEEAKEVAGICPGTKTVPLNKGRGAKIADFLMVYGGLLDRPFGSGEMIAATGNVVIERVQEEIECLRGIEGVDEQILFEILRLLCLLEMDLKLVGAAQKQSTLFERLEQAKKHCREALLLANAL